MSAESGELVGIVRRSYEALAAGDPAPMLQSLSPAYRCTCHSRNRFHDRVSFAVDGRTVTGADVIAIMVFEDGWIVDTVDVSSSALNRSWQDGADNRDAIA